MRLLLEIEIFLLILTMNIESIELNLDMAITNLGEGKVKRVIVLHSTKMSDLVEHFCCFIDELG